MVERLKAAIEKARERRNALSTIPAPGDDAAPDAAMTFPPSRSGWASLDEVTLDRNALERSRVVNFDRDPRLNQPFDLVRTRLLKVCADNGWRRIGVTSPTKGCGKTTLCANLSFSLARHPMTYVVVMDLDLRAPSLARTLGLPTDASMTDFLSGAVGCENVLSRVGERLAFGLNAHPAADAAERLHHAEADAALARMIATLDPSIVLYDLPPMLAGDETLGFLDRVDALLIVAAAGSTTAGQIEACDRLLGAAAPLIGVVLNKCEDEGLDDQQYDYPTV